MDTLLAKVMNEWLWNETADADRPHDSYNMTYAVRLDCIHSI